jgi:AcrR family transcriptional regulator
MNKEKIQDKRTAVMNATLDLILRQGFHDSPMSVVAKEAGVSAGIIYHYFKSKDEIIDALYEEYRCLFMALSLDLDDTSNSYKSRFKHLFTVIFEFYKAHPKLYLFAESYQKTPFFQRVPKELIQEMEQPLLDFLKKGVFTQQLRDTPYRILLKIVLSNIGIIAQMDINREAIIDFGLQENMMNATWAAIKRD